MTLGRRLMIWSFNSGRRLSIRVVFHSFVSLERRSDTIRSVSFKRTGPIGLKFVFGCIQESFQTDVDSPFPIAFPRCFNRRSRPRSIPRHPWEIAVDAAVLRNGVLWQYFPRRTFAKRHSGLVISLHPIFASKALLKVCISRNPKPPSSLVVSFYPRRSSIFFSLHLLSPTKIWWEHIEFVYKD